MKGVFRMTNEMIGYGVVGVGYFGAELARAMKKIKERRLYQYMIRKMVNKYLQNLNANVRIV